MITLHLCQHRLELLTRAVKAYKPAADEKVQHKELLDFLTAQTEENRLPTDLNPEDIPF